MRGRMDPETGRVGIPRDIEGEKIGMIIVHGKIGITMGEMEMDPGM